MADGTGLAIAGLDAFHGDVQAVSGLSLALAPGETLALIGANGAGKTSLLGAIAGLVQARGTIRLRGQALDAMPASARARAGVALSPEGRRLFPSLDVRENLLMGATVGRKGPWDLGRVEALFPILKDFARRPAGLLSGGQQQMVAIGRSLMANPDLLLLDEVSLGLAPVVADEVHAAISRIRGKSGMICILVEQDIDRALAVADRYFCLLEGRLVMEGIASGVDLAALGRAYFGEAA